MPNAHACLMFRNCRAQNHDGTLFENIHFLHVDFTGANLSECVFRGCTFTHACLLEACLIDTHLIDCSFDAASFATLDPTGARLTNCRIIPKLPKGQVVRQRIYT